MNIWKTPILLGFLMGLPVETSAQMTPREACRADVLKFCLGVKRERKAIVNCLSQHRAEISVQCKEAVRAMVHHDRSG